MYNVVMQSWISLIFISIALAMDAFALSIVNGIRYSNITKTQAVIIALTFAIFQGAMPTLGYFLGSLFMSYIEAYDHWVAFGLLTLIGLWMIIEGIKGLVKPETIKIKTFSFHEVFIQGIATSIDALAVGITLTTFEIFILWDALTITAITFAICILGVILGIQINKLLKGRITISNIIGGSILIILGTVILFEHLLA